VVAASVPARDEENCMGQRRRWILGLTAATLAVATLGACGGSPDKAIDTGLSATVPSTQAGSSTSASTPPATTTESSSEAATTTSAASTTVTTSRAPAVRTDPLTGQQFSHNPVVAVKIDNTSAAFPQFGIAAADVVYVEQVEGGLTRLIAIFHTTLPTEAGPARSVRTTDVQLLPSYGDPLLVFSGGKTAILGLLEQSRVIDTSSGPGYHRTSLRSAPYNLIANLPEIVAQHPGKAAVTSNGMTFASADPRVAAGPVVTKISVTMIEGQTSFRYADGAYTVFHHGSPYQDASGAAVSAANVVVQHVTDAPDGYVDVLGSPSFLTKTVGTGAFTLYRDGHAIAGTWKRAAANDPTQYLDATGKPVPFKPGKTWVVLAPQTATMSTG
jgi:hypothetical protein